MSIIDHLGTAANYREVFGIPHLIGEFTFETVTGLVLYPLIKRAVRRHDRVHHTEVHRPTLRLVKPSAPIYDFVKEEEQLAIRVGL